MTFVKQINHLVIQFKKKKSNLGNKPAPATREVCTLASCTGVEGEAGLQQLLLLSEEKRKKADSDKSLPVAN